MALEPYIQQNYHPIHHHHRVLDVEIDWILNGPEGVLFLEVKAGKSSGWQESLLGSQQKRRLMKAYNYWQAQNESVLDCHLIEVWSDGRTAIYPDILSV